MDYIIIIIISIVSANFRFLFRLIPCSQFDMNIGHLDFSTRLKMETHTDITKQEKKKTTHSISHRWTWSNTDNCSLLSIIVFSDKNMLIWMTRNRQYQNDPPKSRHIYRNTHLNPMNRFQVTVDLIEIRYIYIWKKNQKKKEQIDGPENI